ncbi:MAG: exo-alpha-sialidase [Bacteroidota bacterium]
MRHFYLLLLVLACGPASQNDGLETKPGQKASLVPTLSDVAYQRDFTMSPDGKLRLFTLTTYRSVFSTIVLQHNTLKGWGNPEVAPFSGRYRDLEPFFSPDGLYLYFASTRPLPEGGDSMGVNLWRVKHMGDCWGEPKALSKLINRAGDDFYPSLAANGNLYFTAAYDDAIGREDIYLARWEEGRYQQPEPLDSAVNSKGFEFNAFVDPQEQYLVYTAYAREDDMGRGDLYISFRTEDGRWTNGQNLGPRVNTPFLDYCPFVSPDGSTLYFTSEKHVLESEYPETLTYEQMRALLNDPQNGSGNIYWIEWPSLLDSLKKSMKY